MLPYTNLRLSGDVGHVPGGVFGVMVAVRGCSSELVVVAVWSPPLLVSGVVAMGERRWIHNGHTGSGREKNAYLLHVKCGSDDYRVPPFEPTVDLVASSLD